MKKWILIILLVVASVGSLGAWIAYQNHLSDKVRADLISALDQITTEDEVKQYIRDAKANSHTKADREYVDRLSSIIHAIELSDAKNSMYIDLDIKASGMWCILVEDHIANSEDAKKCEDEKAARKRFSEDGAKIKQQIEDLRDSAKKQTNELRVMLGMEKLS